MKYKYLFQVFNLRMSYHLSNDNSVFSNIVLCSELPFFFQIYLLPQKFSVTVAQLLVLHSSSKASAIDNSI